MNNPLPAITRLPIGTADAFWERVDKRDPGECWPWLGSNAGDGTYGRLMVAGRMMGAHVVSLVIASGGRPAGLFCLHSCDNPPCVNPAHLRWGTPADNIRDAVQRGRHKANAKISDAQVVEVRLRVAAGERPAAVASDLGISQASVERFASGRERVGVGGPITNLRGNRKLTDRQVEEIRARAARGETATSMVPIFGLSRRAISRVVSGESYKQKESSWMHT